MGDLVISIRKAKVSDAEGLAGVHDAAWREAYRGVIPGVALERMVAKRGPRWWRLAAASRNRTLSVLDLGERIAGYASYGASRSLGLPQRGEIDEFYIDPVCQGVGLGRRLFQAVRRDLASLGYKSTLVWALSDNERARSFYLNLGGREVATSETRFGGVPLTRVAYAFD
jgi:ribosomal protein S18 acetylase RimI-like enzyme